MTCLQEPTLMVKPATGELDGALGPRSPELDADDRALLARYVDAFEGSVEQALDRCWWPLDPSGALG